MSEKTQDTVGSRIRGALCNYSIILQLLADGNIDLIDPEAVRQGQDCLLRLKRYAGHSDAIEKERQKSRKHRQCWNDADDF